MRFVYILQSGPHPDRYYVGLAEDVATRLCDHNAGRSSHTAKLRPWKLRVTIRFEDPSQAAKFERYLKSGSGRAFAKRHF